MIATADQTETCLPILAGFDGAGEPKLGDLTDEAIFCNLGFHRVSIAGQRSFLCVILGFRESYAGIWSRIRSLWFVQQR